MRDEGPRKQKLACSLWTKAVHTRVWLREQGGGEKTVPVGWMVWKLSYAGVKGAKSAIPSTTQIPKAKAKQRLAWLGLGLAGVC